MIEPGSPAPDFTLPDQDGNKVSLSDFRGRTVVLVFYPADFSRVCTDQLSVYQEVLPQLEERARSCSASRSTARSATRPSSSTRGSPSRCSPTSTRRARWPRRTASGPRSYGVAGRALVMVGPDGVVQWSYSSPPLEVPGANLIFDALEQRTPA